MSENKKRKQRTQNAETTGGQKSELAAVEPLVEPSVEPGVVDRKIVLTSDLVESVYANHVTVKVNNYDASMFFGEVVEASDLQLTVQPKVRIVMTHEFARHLVRLMATELPPLLNME